MTQTFRCHQCKADIEVTPANADMQVKCPACGTRQIAPRLQAAAVGAVANPTSVESLAVTNADSPAPTVSKVPKKAAVSFLSWLFLAPQFRVPYGWMGSAGWAIVVLAIPQFWNARAEATDPMVRIRFTNALGMAVVLAAIAFLGGYALYRSNDPE